MRAYFEYLRQDLIEQSSVSAKKKTNRLQLAVLAGGGNSKMYMLKKKKKNLMPGAQRHFV